MCPNNKKRQKDDVFFISEQHKEKILFFSFYKRFFICFPHSYTKILEIYYQKYLKMNITENRLPILIHIFKIHFLVFLATSFQKQSFGGVLKKDTLKDFAKFTGKNIC